MDKGRCTTSTPIARLHEANMEEQTEFYHNNSTVINGKITYHLFSETNQAEHARMKRPIVKYYSLPSCLTLEPLMDSVIGDFCDQLETRFMGGGQTPCDLGEWIGFCMFNLIMKSWSDRRHRRSTLGVVVTKFGRLTRIRLMGHERRCVLLSTLRLYGQ